MSHYSKIAVIGLGLVGSSLARVIKARGLAAHLVLYDKDSATRTKAHELKLGDVVAANLAAAVADADLVVLAIPVGAMGGVAAELAPHLKKGAVLTDTGSTKTSVVRDIAPHLPESVVLIPSHPVAGTEYSGPESGFESLFHDRYWIMIPDYADDESLAQFRAFIEATGAVVEVMDCAYHDKVLALTSHLPHLIAYTIVGTAFDLEQDLQNDVIRFSASGFRDFTRIAASDPVMWRDVFVNNGEAVLEMLQRFNEDLSYLQRAIRYGESDKLETLFTRTRDIRARIKDAGQLDD